jgi:hypothetical protein
MFFVVRKRETKNKQDQVNEMVTAAGERLFAGNDNPFAYLDYE